MDVQAAPEGRRQRLAGIDAARGLAIIGMLMVHFGPKGETDLLGRLYALPHGRASVLFVLVAGVGVALLSARPEKWPEVRMRLFSFALFLLPLGLILEVLKHPVAVILHHYAAFFLVGIAAIGLTRRQLAVAASLATIIGPLLFYAGMMVAPRVFDRGSADILDGPVAILSAILFTGPYPLIVWSAPLLWGVWIGRQDLRDRRVSLKLMIVGIGAAAAAHMTSELLFAGFGEPGRNPDWRFVFADSAHSEMPLWLISSTGAACFALGATLAAASALPRIVGPLADLGKMALTVYVIQVLALTVAAGVLHQREVIPAIISVTIFTTLAIAFAIIWGQTVGRGPIERMMHGVWHMVADIWPATARTSAATGSQSWRRSDR